MPKDHSIRYGEMHLRKRRNVERRNIEGSSEINLSEVILKILLKEKTHNKGAKFISPEIKF